MSRLGCALLLCFVVVIGGFALVAKRGAAPTFASVGRVSVPPAGRLLVPVQGMPASALADTWGQARSAGAREHHAIDIVAPRGTAVIAAAAGTVEKIFESRDGGHTVYIRRVDPSWLDYYAHLDAYAPDLREGAVVRAGDSIGSVGASGDASAEAPHLHYEVKRMAAGEKWWQGTDVNPYPLLRPGG